MIEAHTHNALSERRVSKRNMGRGTTIAKYQYTDSFQHGKWCCEPVQNGVYEVEYPRIVRAYIRLSTILDLALRQFRRSPFYVCIPLCQHLFRLGSFFISIVFCSPSWCVIKSHGNWNLFYQIWFRASNFSFLGSRAEEEAEAYIHYTTRTHNRADLI